MTSSMSTVTEDRSSTKPCPAESLREDFDASGQLFSICLSVSSIN